METDLYDLTVNYILENQEKFYRLAYSYVKNKDSALDIVQNSICTALEKCYSLKNPCAIKTWLYRIIVNESLKHINKGKKESAVGDEMPEQTYTEPSFNADISAEEILNAVESINEPFKTIIILHYYEDLTLKEISEITKTNLSTVKTRLYSGLGKIKKILSQEVVI